MTEDGKDSGVLTNACDLFNFLYYFASEMQPSVSRDGREDSF